MKKYWIDESIITPDGELLPKGFILTVEKDSAIIEVPIDIYGDNSLLYEEETIRNIFNAMYANTKEPVHRDDGELIGEPYKE